MPVPNLMLLLKIQLHEPVAGRKRLWEIMQMVVLFLVADYVHLRIAQVRMLVQHGVGGGAEYAWRNELELARQLVDSV